MYICDNYKHYYQLSAVYPTPLHTSKQDRNFLFSPYVTPDVIEEPLTNKNISYIKVLGICPSPRATGRNRTHDRSVTRHDFYRYATRWVTTFPRFPCLFSPSLDVSVLSFESGRQHGNSCLKRGKVVYRSECGNNTVAQIWLSEPQ